MLKAPQKPIIKNEKKILLSNLFTKEENVIPTIIQLIVFDIKVAKGNIEEDEKNSNSLEIPNRDMLPNPPPINIAINVFTLFQILNKSYKLILQLNLPKENHIKRLLESVLLSKLYYNPPKTSI